MYSQTNRNAADFVRVFEPPLSGTVIGFSYFGHLTSPEGPTPLVTPPIMWISAEVKPDHHTQLEARQEC